jgi:hypothetical protein
MSRLACLLFLLTPAICAAQFTYAPVNVPGAVATEARGINNSGEIVGFYKTAACADYDIKVPNCPTEGFKYVNGSYIRLMVPGSITTAILGVNDYGDLVGFYSEKVSSCSNPVFHGFIWYHQNVVKTIDYPGADGCNNYSNYEVTGTTVPFGINTAGTVVGGIWGITPTGAFPNTGWVWVDGKFSVMNPGQVTGSSTCCWSVNGISNNGILSGQVFRADFWEAWMKESTDDDFYMNHEDTFGTGLNSNVDTVGYSGANGWIVKSLEANEGSGGSEKEANPAFTPLAYPGSGSTLPFGFNDHRAVVGTYSDSTNVLHGFMATAD